MKQATENQNYDNPESELYQNFVNLYQQYLAVCLNQTKADQDFALKQFQNIQKLFQDWYNGVNPENLAEFYIDYIRDFGLLCEVFQENNLDPKRLPNSKSSDKRFKGERWQTHSWFNFWMQNYYLFCAHLMKLVKHNPLKNSKTQRQLLFFSKLWLDALSPSNYLLTNPDVIAATLNHQGENLFSGYMNFMKDIINGKGQWHIRMSDFESFNLGENIAATKGKVIFKNRMMELIYFEPSTREVAEIPLLIIPPWINKYYILDLQPKNSFVKWIVDQGYSVYMISWVNPDASYKETSFEDYMQEGVLSAISAIQQRHNVEKINTLGFCIGGTLLAATCGYLKAQKKDIINSATYLTTLIDFSDPGEIEIFIDEAQVQALEELMLAKGVLSGARLMLTFNLLRANDLFWSFYVNNYLHAEKPLPFDLLYWNSDYVNLPYKMHSFYLRNMYLENNLIKPGGISLNNTPIDLSQCDLPAYFLSTEQDHIAPWKTTFIGAKNFKGPTTFVLGESGHIAGVVNPPTKKKYGYRVLKDEIKLSEVTDCDHWHENSVKHSDSWWHHWINWLSLHSGKKTDKNQIDIAQYPALYSAPGQYVKRRQSLIS